MKRTYQPNNRRRAEAPRVPASDVDAGRSGSAPVATAQGSPSSVGLIWRIRDRRTFLELRRSGRRVRAGGLSLTFLADPPERHDPPRVAYAISRRVGNAVVRNRVRRRMRALMPGLLGSAPGGAYLVVVQPSAAASSSEQLRGDLNRALAKLSTAARGQS